MQAKIRARLESKHPTIGEIPLWIIVVGFASLVIIPIINTVLYSVSKGWYYPHLFPPKYTLMWFMRTFMIWRLHETFLNTIIVAAIVTVGSILIAFPAAYILARENIPGENLITVILIMPLFLPGLIYGIPVARVIYKMGLNNTYLGIAIIQCVPILPFVLLMLRGVIASIPISLEEQAATLGANKLQVFRRIIVPLIRPGLMASAAWAIAKSISEFALTFLVAGADTTTLSIVLYSSYDAPGMMPTDNAALTIWLFVPAALFMGLAMKYLKPTEITLKGV